MEALQFPTATAPVTVAEPEANVGGTADNAPKDDGLSFCVWGVVCLIGGLFVFGIPLGIAAISLGGRAAERGHPTFGGFLRVAGWIEIVLSVVGIVAMASGGL
jgi:hypothetical protein